MVMAFSSSSSWCVFLLVSLQMNLALVLGCDTYTSIFSFGDSLVDTGNRIYTDAHSPYTRYPYGITFFNHPTGRASDGRLIIDFFAQALGLPFLPPYLGHENQDFQRGVNFAVAGATAVDAAFFHSRGVHVSSNCSLGVQFGLFKQLLPSLCSSPSECQDRLRNTLFVVGTIGGNDYNNPFLQGKDIQETQNLVPKVIHVISSTVNELIKEGARTLVVPGNIPIGCVPGYLTMFESQNNGDYDHSTGCLNWLNEFSQHHNNMLQKELNRLRKIHPHATIIYADYYNVALEMYRRPKQLGFSGGALRACCGAESRYKYNSSAKCGCKGSKVCDDPSLYVSWDGMHLTEAAYKWIATGILEGPFTTPRLNVSCTASNPGNVDHPYDL